MWFRRQPKNRNRRIGRDYVLDVKLRSDQVRATRVRWATIVFCLVFGTFFGLYLVWRTGELLLDKFVYKNPDFAIQNIEVQTDGVLAPDQLRRLANVRAGANLIRLDLAAVKANLELESAIETASIERVLPRTLRIRVTERDPIAQVNAPCVDANGNFALAVTQLDRNGVAMKPRDPRECVVSLSQLNLQLPVIVGLNVVKLKLGQPVPGPDLSRACAALDLVAAFDHSPMAGLVDLRRVDITSPGAIVVTTGQGGTITFAPNNFDQQFARWRQIYDYGKRMNKGDIASVDLAVENNLPVHWMLASTTPVINKPKLKPVKTRRNNV
jgi:cell division septal protein FtsQ